MHEYLNGNRTHMAKEGLVKIFFKLEANEWHGLQTESLWAEPVARTIAGDIFRIKNSPFFTREVSFLDTVRAVVGDHIRGLDFAGLIEPSGHSTYRLIVPNGRSDFDGSWSRLERIGCSYESGSIKQGTLYSVDVPDTTDIYEVYQILELGQSSNVWMFEEGRIGHKLKL